MKKIAIVYSGGRQWGGIETYLKNLFMLYDRQRMHLFLISLGEWDLTRELEQQGLSEDLRVLSAKRLRLRTLRDLRRAMVDTSAGLIVSQGVVANAYARIVSLWTKVPNLTVVHSKLELDYPRAMIRWLYGLIDRILRAGTTSYVAVSGYLKDQLVRSGVDPAKVQVIYNGIGKPAEKDADDAPRDTHLLVSVGRLHRVKNYDSLVKAMALLPTDTSLTIWGEGHERSALESLVEQLGLTQRVRLPGKYEGGIGVALAGADIYLQPSWSEGFGLALTEAMIYAKPVVIAPYGGLLEQVRDKVTGLVTKDGSPESIAEAVRVLLDDPELARRLGLAGKKDAERTCDIGLWLENITQAFSRAASESV